MRGKRFWHLAKKAVFAWLDDYAPSMGAAISYYTVFSIAPLLIIVIAVAGAVWGEDAVRGEIGAQLAGLIGDQGAQGVQTLVRVADKPAQGLIASIAGVVVLLIGATTVFAELQSALDRIWHVPEQRKRSGLWNLLRARLLSFGLILALAFLLLVSLVVSAALAALGSLLGVLLPGWEVLLQVLNIAVALAFETLLFAMIFKFMPQIDIAWRDVWTGALVTAILFELGKVLIGLYVGRSAFASSFSAASSIVVVLIWVYYAAQVFLLGAEFTRVYATEHGSHASGAGNRADARVPDTAVR